jgi:hypothetical protein
VEKIFDGGLTEAQMQLAQLAAQFAATQMAAAEKKPSSMYERAEYLNDAITAASELLQITVLRTTPPSSHPY